MGVVPIVASGRQYRSARWTRTAMILTFFAHCALRILMETQPRVHSSSTLHIKVKLVEFDNLLQSSVRYLCRPGKRHKRGNVPGARARFCFHHHHQENKALISKVWKYFTLVIKSDSFFFVVDEDDILF